MQSWSPLRILCVSLILQRCTAFDRATSYSRQPGAGRLTLAERLLIPRYMPTFRYGNPFASFLNVHQRRFRTVPVNYGYKVQEDPNPNGFYAASLPRRTILNNPKGPKLHYWQQRPQIAVIGKPPAPPPFAPMVALKSWSEDATNPLPLKRPLKVFRTEEDFAKLKDEEEKIKEAQRRGQVLKFVITGLIAEAAKKQNVQENMFQKAMDEASKEISRFAGFDNFVDQTLASTTSTTTPTPTFRDTIFIKKKYQKPTWTGAITARPISGVPGQVQMTTKLADTHANWVLFLN